MIRFLITILVITGLCSCSTAQDMTSCLSTHETFLEEQHREFANPEDSPLPEERVKDFKSINYYPYDESYCVEARWVLTPGETPFEMVTSTDRRPIYVKYGELHFEIKGQPVVLAVYQSESLVEVDGYEDYLFIPFNDLTNGVSSYGGGRFMDMRIPDGDKVQLNLNNTYHPYCAYNHVYSCPLPPDENVLDVAIEAGVMLGINGVKGDEKH